jgi:delta 1-pyrroline-5-carboxylate dehydrogenase
MPQVPDEKRCRIEGCALSSVGQSLCATHYQQDRRGRLGKSQPIVAPGEHAEIVISLSKAERKEIYARAKKAGLTGPRYALSLIRQSLKAD